MAAMEMHILIDSKQLASNETWPRSGKDKESEEERLIQNNTAEYDAPITRLYIHNSDQEIRSKRGKLTSVPHKPLKVNFRAITNEKTRERNGAGLTDWISRIFVFLSFFKSL